MAKAHLKPVCKKDAGFCIFFTRLAMNAESKTVATRSK
jgi:hypothetical protein